jgi:hypothetical protein
MHMNMIDLKYASVRRAVPDILLTSVSVCILLWVFVADENWLDRHFLPDFRIPQIHMIVALQVVRVLAAAVALVLFFWVRPWVRGVVERRGFLRLAIDCGPTLAAALLAVPAAELVLRMTVKQNLERKEAAHEPRRAPDPVLGFSFVPSRVSYGEVGGRRIRYVFDAAGFRVRDPGDQVDPSRPSIVYVGESIMCGYGLDWDETIAAQVQARTGLQSADLAVEGYSIDQAYLRFRQQWGRFERPVAVVTLFLPSGMYRTLEETRPRFAPALVWRPPEDPWWLERVIRRRASYRSTAEVDSTVVVARQVFQATARAARAKGAKPLVVVPVFTPEPTAERKLRERVLKGAGVPYILVPIDRAWRLPDNRHPDPRGARVLAAAIIAQLGATNGQVAPAR